MGRFEKVILNEEGLDRRNLGYYSTPRFISSFMTNAMLEINPNGLTALDPCVGKEELIKDLYEKKIDIDGIDIIDHGDYFHCSFKRKDFIEYYKERKAEVLFDQNFELKYDYYIANPPYNCHEVDYIRNNKKQLGKLFNSVGVHNMYSMFISAIIDCAKEGALISLIISDSFLTTRMHNNLRKQIVENCSIHYLILCPQDLFWDQKADVRTCIMILEKGNRIQKKIKILNRPKSREELKEKLKNRDFMETTIYEVIRKNQNSEISFCLDVPSEIQKLFELPTIGEMFKCLTGISTGNDKAHLSKIIRPGFEVPFFKNPGSRKFYCEPDAYLTNDYLKIATEISNFIVRNKKYLLKEGITCSSMGLPFGACFLPSGSTFGVNANIFCDKKDIWWLLGYLNSSLVTFLLRGVIIRSNMVTSGYVSQLPVIQFSKEAKKKLHKISTVAYKNKIEPSQTKDVIKAIDEIVFNEIKLSLPVQSQVLVFCENLINTV